MLPAALGDGDLEPGFDGRLLAQNEPGSPRHALKLSAAFGGCNAALVLGPPLPAGEPGPASALARPELRVLYESARVVEPDLALIARRSRLEPVRIERLERASALAVTAVAIALDASAVLAAADPARVAVIVATEGGCLEANEAFDAKRRERGPRGVEPRRFPATSPNLPAGLCSIAFGLTGPSFAIGGGQGALEQARHAAALLLRAGDADHVIIVVADDVGKVVRDVLGGARLPLPADGAAALVLGLAASSAGAVVR
jgi:3-oxoacyl-[acyl-carrier-protein] synthase-1/3-oxoacyl-[acyl-carrier-protein] synthase II